MPDKKLNISVNIDGINSLNDLKTYIEKLKTELKEGNISAERANQITAEAIKLEERFYKLSPEIKLPNDSTKRQNLIEYGKTVENIKEASIRTGKLISDLDVLTSKIVKAQAPIGDGPLETTQNERFKNAQEGSNKVLLKTLKDFVVGLAYNVVDLPSKAIKASQVNTEVVLREYTSIADGKTFDTLEKLIKSDEVYLKKKQQNLEKYNDEERELMHKALEYERERIEARHKYYEKIYGARDQYNKDTDKPLTEKIEKGITTSGGIDTDANAKHNNKKSNTTDEYNKTLANSLLNQVLIPLKKAGYLDQKQTESPTQEKISSPQPNKTSKSEKI
ncbi:hypothetical protein LJC00_04340, partial [Dysgonomonas sp. OttesenSCG-928-M03]|nr:hypothetical protein [Dysgonomonas sp. OttesenSCG-928-M03]